MRRLGPCLVSADYVAFLVTGMRRATRAGRVPNVIYCLGAEGEKDIFDSGDGDGA